MLFTQTTSPTTTRYPLPLTQKPSMYTQYQVDRKKKYRQELPLAIYLNNSLVDSFNISTLL